MRKCAAGRSYDGGMEIPRRHERGRLPHQDVLTPAEWRVLQHVRERRTNAEIAVRLGVSINTVRTHVSSMLAKLGLDDRDALARWDGEPAPVSRAAIARHGPRFASRWVPWVPRAWARLAPAAEAGAAVGAVAVIAVVIALAAAGSRDARDETVCCPRRLRRLLLSLTRQLPSCRFVAGRSSIRSRGRPG